mmetsp:Transcript_1215/g.2215  ORF Transcript_1215/g.2215 Transcript_1215/m.2215 type:complete len:178 (-) Transcript_1215:394-927(-)
METRLLGSVNEKLRRKSEQHAKFKSSIASGQQRLAHVTEINKQLSEDLLHLKAVISKQRSALDSLTSQLSEKEAALLSCQIKLTDLTASSKASLEAAQSQLREKVGELNERHSHDLDEKLKRLEQELRAEQKAKLQDILRKIEKKQGHFEQSAYEKDQLLRQLQDSRALLEYSLRDA